MWVINCDGLYQHNNHDYDLDLFDNIAPPPVDSLRSCCCGLANSLVPGDLLIMIMMIVVMMIVMMVLVMIVMI